MTPSTDDRCGYQLEIGIAEDDLPTEACERPVWDHEGNDADRCVWHAKVDGKTSELFEDAPPQQGEKLDGAYLKGAHLVGVDWFADTSLIYANFTDASINASDFSNANLMLATLTNVSGINANFGDANLEGATFTNGDLRRANLENAFLNEAVFTDVHIGSETQFGDASVYESESAQPTLSDDHRLRAAAWAYRQLQQLYQDNALPRLARRSYNQEKDARRRLTWDEGNYSDGIKWELSRWVARYGSSPYRVLLTSAVVIVGFAFLFPLTGGIQETQGSQTITYTLENPENAPQWWIGRVLFKSLYFSVVTFATLGYGDIQPIGTSARFLAGLEALLGALLAALLVFVLARIVTW